MMRRSPMASTAIGLGALSLALVAGLTACASSGTAGASAGGGSNSLAYGYMVPGAGAAAALSVRATDTIPELTARATVPSVVLNAIAQEVASGTWDNKCTRRFGGPATYVVIFFHSCDPSLGPEADPKVVVSFGADGRRMGRMAWTGPNTVAVLNPVRRF